MTAMTAMTTTELRRLSELRSVLEGFAARHAATHATASPAKLKQLRSTLKRLTNALLASNYSAFRHADLELHETIVNLANIPLLRETWRAVWDNLGALHKRGFDDCFPDPRTIAEEHEHLVETIALGDPAGAEDAARTHIEAVWFGLAEQGNFTTEPEGDPLKRAVAHLVFRLHCPLKLTHVARKNGVNQPRKSFPSVP
jgi:DNA-binding GntR family transcriptional regulator